MQLLLMRHGEAEPYANSDPERPLHESGRQEVLHRALQLKKGGYVPDKLVASPYLRARQTALIVAEELHLPAPSLSEAITPAAEPEEAAAALRAIYGSVKIGLAVMHQPVITRLIYFLTGREQPMMTSDVALLEAPVIARGSCQFICTL